MKYGEEIIKLFQYYIDNGIKPTGETRVGVVIEGKVIDVYSNLHAAMYDETPGKLREPRNYEKKVTFICFFPLIKQYPTNVYIKPSI